MPTPNQDAIYLNEDLRDYSNKVADIHCNLIIAIQIF